MIWTALVLAGSRGPEDQVAQAAGVAHKAMAEIAGRPMIAHVLDALAGCDAIGQIAVTGPADLELPPDAQVLPAASSPAASVLAGLDTLGTPLLITTADNPLLRAETVTAFLEASTASHADVTAAVAARKVVELAGNPGRRTYLKFSNGAYSGCNLFAISQPEGRRAVEFWRQLEAQRKRPWRMVLTIGPGALVRYLSGWLSLDDAARAIATRAGCRGAVVRLRDPYAAHDVDKPADLAFARHVLEGRQSRGE